MPGHSAAAVEPDLRHFGDSDFDPGSSPGGGVGTAFAPLTTHRSRPQSLLGDPNPNSPANAEAAQLYSENRREYDRRVRAVVEGSWASAAGADDTAEGAAPAPADAPAVGT